MENQIIHGKNIYIVGAHSRGRTFKEYITFLYPEVVVEAYLVDESSENKSEIDGIQVMELRKASKLNLEYPVYIATRGVYHEKITKELKRLGMQYIYPVDVDLDSRLRNEYVRRVYKENKKEYLKIDDDIFQKEIQAKIYVASSINDKKPDTSYAYLPEEKIIQVGAELTDKRLENAFVYDNAGENISNKNNQYCELTALFWMWKNASEDYIGLVHYRRHFLLPPNWAYIMDRHHIDVILPVPLYVAPSISENYKERHIASDWEYLMQYFKNNMSEEYDSAKTFFDGNLYSPCNMLITRREVLNHLCSWLFPIIDKVVEHGGKKDDLYMNRYPGFISERLITYFFESRRDKYKIVYANKNFLQ